MINIFLKKSYTKCGGEANPTLFYEKSKVKKSNFGFIFSEQAEKRDLDIQETVSTFT